MQSNTLNSNILPFTHRPMKVEGKLFQYVPEPSSLEPLVIVGIEFANTVTHPPVFITTPYQLIVYMLKMVKLRNHERYLVDSDNVVKNAWEANVVALDKFIRQGLGLAPDSEESRIINSLFILLEWRKMQDRRPEDNFWNADYQTHWVELSDIACHYIKKNQLE